MDVRTVTGACGALLIATLLVGCGSTARTGSGAPSANTPPSTTAPPTSTAPPTNTSSTAKTSPPSTAASTMSSVPPNSGEPTVLAPHIRCEPGTLRRSYDSTGRPPVELCLRVGAVVAITIRTGHQTWAPPTVTGRTILRIVATHARSGSATITVSAASAGVARIVAGPSKWTLTIAVVS